MFLEVRGEHVLQSPVLWGYCCRLKPFPYLPPPNIPILIPESCEYDLIWEKSLLHVIRLRIWGGEIILGNPP